MLYMLFCMLFCILADVEGELCLLEMLEVLEVMRNVLLYMLEAVEDVRRILNDWKLLNMLLESKMR